MSRSEAPAPARRPRKGSSRDLPPQVTLGEPRQGKGLPTVAITPLETTAGEVVPGFKLVRVLRPHDTPGGMRHPGDQYPRTIEDAHTLAGRGVVEIVGDYVADAKEE